VSTGVLIALAWTIATRLFELWLSRRNRELALAAGARDVDDGYKPMVLVHVAWIVGLAAEDYWIGPHPALAGARGALLGVYVASELLRYWCIATLGERWNVRVLVRPNDTLVARGPYRFLPHPNYLGVVVGMVSLPLALGLVWMPLVVVPLKLLVLRHRIRIEARELERASRPATT